MFWPLLGTGVPFRFRLTVLPGCWLLAYLAVAPPIPSQADEPALKQSWGELSADKDRLAREFAQFVNAGKLDEAVATAEKWLAVARRLLSAKPGGANGEKALQQARREIGTLLELYLAQGDYARRPLLQRAEESTEKTFGENHFRYALSLNNLACLYRSRGDYARAMPLCRQALEIERKALGDGHPVYAATLSNLANVCQALGDYAQAEKLLRQSLEIKRRDLGADRPGYALGLNNLAALYYDRDDYARAEPLYRQALEIHRRVFGENHPDYARNLNNLAAVYHAQGDWRRAEPLYEQAAEVRKRAFGESHPGYAVSVNNLGDTLLRPRRLPPRRAAAPPVIARHAGAACGGGHRPVAAAAVGHARGRPLLPRRLPGTGRTRRPLRGRGVPGDVGLEGDRAAAAAAGTRRRGKPGAEGDLRPSAASGCTADARGLGHARSGERSRPANPGGQALRPEGTPRSRTVGPLRGLCEGQSPGNAGGAAVRPAAGRGTDRLPRL